MRDVVGFVAGKSSEKVRNAKLITSKNKSVVGSQF